MRYITECGIARVGRSIFDLRGIRFVEGEDGNAPDAEVETETAVDVSVYEAKIAELSATIAELEATIAVKDAEIVATKAANYDLLTASPVAEIEAGEELSPDAVDVTPEDLFGKDDD